jgi:hypothetical protein
MDMSWLAHEAKQVHDLFSHLFYSMTLTLLLIGIVLSFFQMPLGQAPQFLILVGRVFIAGILMIAFPEIMNALADLADNLSRELGQLNNIHLLVSRLGDKLHTFSWSWTAVKDSVLIVVSYVTFALVYISVELANAMFLFSWMLLYLFSPVLIAAFVLPATASATKGLFESLFEVSCWKVLWGVQAALLWSYGLSQIDKPGYDVDFISAILLNLILALSVVATPIVVGKLLHGGLHQAAAMLGGTVLAAAGLSPGGLLNRFKSKGDGEPPVNRAVQRRADRRAIDRSLQRFGRRVERDKRKEEREKAKNDTEKSKGTDE